MYVLLLATESYSQGLQQVHKNGIESLFLCKQCWNPCMSLQNARENVLKKKKLSKLKNICQYTYLLISFSTNISGVPLYGSNVKFHLLWH